MKKATRKLGIRRETLRVLSKLDLVAGGNAQLLGTEGPATGCQVVDAALVDTGDMNRTCVA
jgi:hypothetical protein